MIKKQTFLDVFKTKIGDYELADKAIAYASIWWDLNASIDHGFPCALNWSWMMVRKRHLDMYAECLDQSVVSKLEGIAFYNLEVYRNAFISSMIEVGVYREKWVFSNPYDDTDDGFSDTFDIGFVGDTDNEDVQYYEEQYNKSFDAFSKFEMSFQYNMVVNYTNSDSANSYNSNRGSVCDPESGMGDYDPIICMQKVCELVNEDYERTLVVIPHDDELLEQLKIIVSPDVLEKARQMAIQKKIEEKTAEINERVNGMES
ncbi:hypothetical protein [Photobacterium damselae]|uniref:hypothetical protein n=1 Tax=Photobacterium damselae TaxID=38293 RepID=UPI001F1E60EB|nr:hypothetical protein [Photobacterium damselae]UKA04983.1 hypothetical protein IHC89_22315 [Photobacterium damselae subsp. damselae]